MSQFPCFSCPCLFSPLLKPPRRSELALPLGAERSELTYKLSHDRLETSTPAARLSFPKFSKPFRSAAPSFSISAHSSRRRTGRREAVPTLGVPSQRHFALSASATSNRSIMPSKEFSGLFHLTHCHQGHRFLRSRARVTHPVQSSRNPGPIMPGAHYF